MKVIYDSHSGHYSLLWRYQGSPCFFFPLALCEGIMSLVPSGGDKVQLSLELNDALSLMDFGYALTYCQRLKIAMWSEQRGRLCSRECLGLMLGAGGSVARAPQCPWDRQSISGMSLKSRAQICLPPISPSPSETHNSHCWAPCLLPLVMGWGIIHSVCLARFTEVSLGSFRDSGSLYIQSSFLRNSQFSNYSL